MGEDRRIGALLHGMVRKGPIAFYLYEYNYLSLKLV